MPAGAPYGQPYPGQPMPSGAPYGQPMPGQYMPPPDQKVVYQAGPYDPNMAAQPGMMPPQPGMVYAQPNMVVIPASGACPLGGGHVLRENYFTLTAIILCVIFIFIFPLNFLFLLCFKETVCIRCAQRF
ncbi:hypothetical protein HDU96_010324 [Phlyctochytrium bullatum]|nr:hypothetical protein HDU96_010324 [Phlyctochytrium bullatum]